MTDRPRMMVVEDDRDTAEMLAAYFEAQGYAVTPVAWGADAVRQAQEGDTPDLILLDIRLPDMDGFAMCEELLEDSTGPAVVVTSSRDVSSYRRRLERSRALGFIPKSELSGPALAALVGR